MSISSSTNSAFPRSGSGGGLLHEREVVRATGRDAISTFLDSHTCYSVLRASGKCVVFDTRIPIQLAFYALVEHGKFDDDKHCQDMTILVTLFTNNSEI